MSPPPIVARILAGVFPQAKSAQHFRGDRRILCASVPLAKRVVYFFLAFGLTVPVALGQPRVENTSRGAVSVSLAFDPPTVRLDRDVLLTLSVSAPTNLSVRLPPIESRVKGFVVSGNFEAPPTLADGKAIHRRNIRLTPQISDLYRIAPMAVTWTEPGTDREQWFPTKPVVLAAEALVTGEIGKDIAAPRAPVWIYPGLKGFLGYLLMALGLAAAGYGLWRLFLKLRRAVRLRLMSPRERALFELSELLAKGLPAPDRVKDFYFGLTLIVRAYIERAHAVRAPEQTTEEFLEAVSHDTRFAPETVRRLREFMKAADLVKYAAFRPDPASVDHAVSTAKQYIETDAPGTDATEKRRLHH